jgi:hypothetical protein
MSQTFQDIIEFTQERNLSTVATVINHLLLEATFAIMKKFTLAKNHLAASSVENPLFRVTN